MRKIIDGAGPQHKLLFFAEEIGLEAPPDTVAPSPHNASHIYSEFLGLFFILIVFYQ